MPTKKKRVGFIPREDVIKIIDKLSIENNLSNSKIINILVEEALSIRGIFNRKKGKITNSYQGKEDRSQNLSDNSANFISNEKFTINTKSGNHYKLYNSNYLEEGNKETFDLETYKKFLLFLKFKEMTDKHNI